MSIIKEPTEEELEGPESKLITDKLELHIIDLKRFRKIKEPKGELADWIKLLIGDEEGIIMASKRNKAIEKVNKENKILSLDKEMQEDYWFEQKELYAENTRIIVATEEGRKEEKAKIAKKLLKMKMEIDEIIEVTGLTKEEIEEINTK